MIISQQQFPVTTEILMEYGGMDLMTYRAKNEVKDNDLFHVVYQSAIAIATAHLLGVFHGDLKPKNMLYRNSILKLIDFDISSNNNNKSLINKYRFDMTTNLVGYTQTYCPPEALYYESETLRGQLPITAGKIDSYCWGMSMLQFLTNMSEIELKGYALRLTTSFSESCKVLKRIKRLKISLLKEKTGQSLLRLISKCLKFTPSTRWSMEDVLACLISPNEELKEIITSTPINMNKDYRGIIRSLLVEFSKNNKKGNLDLIEKFKEIEASPLLKPALDEINKLLSSEGILCEILFNNNN